MQEAIVRQWRREARVYQERLFGVAAQRSLAQLALAHMPHGPARTGTEQELQHSIDERVQQALLPGKRHLSEGDQAELALITKLTSNVIWRWSHVETDFDLTEPGIILTVAANAERVLRHGYTPPTQSHDREIKTLGRILATHGPDYLIQWATGDALVDIALQHGEDPSLWLEKITPSQRRKLVLSYSQPAEKAVSLMAEREVSFVAPPAPPEAVPPPPPALIDVAGIVTALTDPANRQPKKPLDAAQQRRYAEIGEQVQAILQTFEDHIHLSEEDERYQYCLQIATDVMWRWSQTPAGAFLGEELMADQLSPLSASLVVKTTRMIEDIVEHAPATTRRDKGLQIFSQQIAERGPEFILSWLDGSYIERLCRERGFDSAPWQARYHLAMDRKLYTLSHTEHELLALVNTPELPRNPDRRIAALRRAYKADLTHTGRSDQRLFTVPPACDPEAIRKLLEKFFVGHEDSIEQQLALDVVSTMLQGWSQLPEGLFLHRLVATDPRYLIKNDRLFLSKCVADTEALCVLLGIDASNANKKLFQVHCLADTLDKWHPSQVAAMIEGPLIIRHCQRYHYDSDKWLRFFTPEVRTFIALTAEDGEEYMRSIMQYIEARGTLLSAAEQKSLVAHIVRHRSLHYDDPHEALYGDGTPSSRLRRKHEPVKTLSHFEKTQRKACLERVRRIIDLQCRVEPEAFSPQLLPEIHSVTGGIIKGWLDIDEKGLFARLYFRTRINASSLTVSDAVLIIETARYAQQMIAVLDPYFKEPSARNRCAVKLAKKYSPQMVEDWLEGASIEAYCLKANIDPALFLDYISPTQRLKLLQTPSPERALRIRIIRIQTLDDLAHGTDHGHNPGHQTLADIAKVSSTEAALLFPPHVLRRLTQRRLPKVAIRKIGTRYKRALGYGLKYGLPSWLVLTMSRHLDQPVANLEIIRSVATDLQARGLSYKLSLYIAYRYNADAYRQTSRLLTGTQHPAHISREQWFWNQALNLYSTYHERVKTIQANQARLDAFRKRRHASPHREKPDMSSYRPTEVEALRYMLDETLQILSQKAALDISEVERVLHIIDQEGDNEQLMEEVHSVIERLRAAAREIQPPLKDTP